MGRLDASNFELCRKDNIVRYVTLALVLTVAALLVSIFGYCSVAEASRPIAIILLTTGILMVCGIVAVATGVLR